MEKYCLKQDHASNITLPIQTLISHSLLNSHSSPFLPFKPIPPTFILYFCLYDRCGSNQLIPS